MTTALACEPTPILSSNHFRILDIGEPIDVRVGLLSSEDDLIGCMKELRQLEVSNLHLVICCPAARMKVLQYYPPTSPRLSTDYLTLVWAPQGTDRQAIEPDDFWKVCHAHRSNLYLIEPDATRAVIGTMQWLREGNTFALLWPAELGFEMAENLVTQGQRWRATMEAPEEGEFHYLPPVSDGM